MRPCPHCGADVGDASPAYCPVCRGPLLGQRTDLPPPPPGVEFDRSADPFGSAGAGSEEDLPDLHPIPQPLGSAPPRGSALKNILRGGFLLLVLGPVAWGFIDGAVNGADRDDSGVIVETGDLEVTELRAGDCFNLPPGTEDDEEILEVEAVPCSEAHENEVYVITNYVAADSYPGDVALWDFADQFCVTAFDTYVGMAYEESLLDFGYFYPNRDGWADGDKEITCVLYDFNGTMLTGSMKGSGV